MKVTNMTSSNDKATRYWIEFSDGDFRDNLTGKELSSAWDDQREFKIVLAWGVKRGAL